jgi:hypothetical protein
MRVTFKVNTCTGSFTCIIKITGTTETAQHLGLEEGQFFCDGASLHHKKIGGRWQGCALHPENKIAGFASDILCTLNIKLQDLSTFI